MFGEAFHDEKIGVTWSNQRLKKIVWHMIYFSEFMPKVWYNRKEFLEPAGPGEEQLGSILAIDNFASVLSQTRRIETNMVVVEENKQNDLIREQLSRWNKDVIVNQDIPEFDEVFDAFYDAKIIDKIISEG
jgi:endonuclease III-like uncharacterized protein